MKIADDWRPGLYVDGTEIVPVLQPGTMVFWLDEHKPRWVVEFQPKNGNCYWLVDATGESAVASPDEVRLRPSQEDK